MATHPSLKNPFDASALQSLQSQKHLELLDIIDNLRAQGLNDHVDLPQLIVCGDQSSGKSSVLAAVSGVPFPKKDNLCTRFATEVILRRDDELNDAHIVVSIMSGSSRASSDRNIPDSFKRELDSISELPSVIDEASNAMGLGSVGGAFSSDILRLEVRGPKLPQLTIVDLPGLIHSENKYQSEEDIKLVTQLVEDYMKQERSIILAIVSAKYDYPNQIVLRKARKVDPQGKRTLGIITKPDTLHPDSGSESGYISLAKNQDVHFSLGWHVVRNLDSNEPTQTDRDAQERQFFKMSRWSTLDESQRGICTLRDRLSAVLFQQIRKELPGLISEIALEMEETGNELAKMGRSRATASEKRLFVVELGQTFNRICHAACEGLYDDEFFQGPETPESTSYRLRAVLQNRNIEFSNKILQATPRYAFRGLDPSGKTVSLTMRAAQLIRSHRGKELPGTFNPLLVGQLFRELSHQWIGDTVKHTESLWLQARVTTVAILNSITDEHVSDACMKLVIDPQLERMRDTVKSRLEDYMREFRRHPITYNHYLTETVQKVREERARTETTRRLSNLFIKHPRLDSSHTRLIIDAIYEEKSAEMDNIAAQSLADYSEAYYKVALKRVIDEVPAHVIEDAIMAPLPRLLESSKIVAMSEDIIDSIGSESEARIKHREALRAKFAILNRSNVICQVYAERSNDIDLASMSSHGQDTPSTHSGADIVDRHSDGQLGMTLPASDPKPTTFVADVTSDSVPEPEPEGSNLVPVYVSRKISKKKKSRIESVTAEPDEPTATGVYGEEPMEVPREVPREVPQEVAQTKEPAQTPDDRFRVQSSSWVSNQTLKSPGRAMVDDRFRYKNALLAVLSFVAFYIIDFTYVGVFEPSLQEQLRIEDAVTEFVIVTEQ